MLLGKSERLAYGGVLSALALMFMYLACIVPSGKLALFALSSFCMGVCIAKTGVKYSLAAYFAVSLLSFFILPQKLYAVGFAAFLGLYPFVKLWCEKQKNRKLEWILKILCANIIFAVIYFAATALFSITENAPVYILLLMFNAFFVIYDIVFSVFVTKIMSIRRNNL